MFREFSLTIARGLSGCLLDTLFILYSKQTILKQISSKLGHPFTKLSGYNLDCFYILCTVGCIHRGLCQHGVKVTPKKMSAIFLWFPRGSGQGSSAVLKSTLKKKRINNDMNCTEHRLPQLTEYHNIFQLHCTLSLGDIAILSNIAILIWTRF